MTKNWLGMFAGWSCLKSVQKTMMFIINRICLEIASNCWANSLIVGTGIVMTCVTYILVFSIKFIICWFLVNMQIWSKLIWKSSPKTIPNYIKLGWNDSGMAHFHIYSWHFHNILDLISGGILGTTCKKTIRKVYFWKDMTYQLPYDYRDIFLPTTLWLQRHILILRYTIEKNNANLSSNLITI